MAFNGCPWDIETAVACIPDDWESRFEEDVWEYAVALASASLNMLSGYRVGGCPIVLRPVTAPADCGPCNPYGLYGPYGPLYRPACTDPLWAAAEPAGCSVRLPGPVGRIDAIKVDGLELTLTDFRVDNGDRLVYQGTDDCPLNGPQDLQLPDTESGTWSVTYLNAIEPDGLALAACASLAYQFALACIDDDGCELPSNVTSITRTGVAMTFNAGIWPDGFTGIRQVDAWISIVNPAGRKGQTRLLSLDLPDPTIQGSAL